MNNVQKKILENLKTNPYLTDSQKAARMLQIKREMEQKEYKKTNMKINQQTIIITLLALLLVTTSFICGFLISESKSDKFNFIYGDKPYIINEKNGDVYYIIDSKIKKRNIIKEFNSVLNKKIRRN